VTKLVRAALATVVVLSIGLTACGGDDDDSASASAGTNSTLSQRDIDAAAAAAGVDKACVQGVQAFTALAGAAGSASTNGVAGIDRSVDALERYADAGPSAIKDELKVLAGAYGAYAKGIADSGWDPKSGKPPTQEQATAISAAGRKISSDEVKTAGDKVSSYFEEHCKRK
jgi:hypothetical protein